MKRMKPRRMKQRVIEHDTDIGVQRMNIDIYVRNSWHIRKLSEFLKKLNPQQRASLESTAFGPLLSFSFPGICQTLICELIHRWCIEKKAFKIGSQYVEFSLRDIAFILGLRVRVVEDDTVQCNSKRYDVLKWFPGKKYITERDVETALRKTSDDDHVEEHTGLVLVYIMVTLLFSNRHLSIGRDYVSLVENVSRFNRMAWGTLVHDFLVKSLSEASNKLTACSGGMRYSRELPCKTEASVKSSRPQTLILCGCAIALQVWAFEHIPPLRPSSIVTKFPRILKYENVYRGQGVPKYRQKLVSRIRATLECDEVIEVLVPTDVESAVAVIKEVLDIDPDGTSSIFTLCTEDIMERSKKNVNFEFCDGGVENRLLDVKLLPELRCEDTRQGQVASVSEGHSKSIEGKAYGPLENVENLKVHCHIHEEMIKEVGKRSSSLKTNIFSKNIKRKWPIYGQYEMKFVNHFSKEKETNEKLQQHSETIDIIEMEEDELDSRTSKEYKKVWTLGGYKWVTSDIMEEYIELLRRRHYSLHEDQNHLKCIFLSVYFMQMIKLRLDGARSHLMEKNNVYSFKNCDMIFVPGHWDGNHWVLYVLHMKKRVIEFFNSLTTMHHCDDDIKELVNFFEENLNFSMHDWAYRRATNIPQQENGHDCGIFVLKYMECLSQGATLSFSQRDIPGFRKKLIADIQASKEAS